MILYHGSGVVVTDPDIFHSRRNVDFGPGFYMTPIYEQARKWCQRPLLRTGRAFISKYRLDEEAFEACKVLEFDTYSEDWLDFIVTCRQGKDTSNYDIVMGGVANDKVFDTVELYFQDLIDKTEAIKRLRYAKPNAQLCIRTQSVIERFLRFEGSEAL